MKVKLSTVTCERCGHTWVPRKIEVYLCPKCKSYKWSEPRTAK